MLDDELGGEVGEGEGRGVFHLCAWRPAVTALDVLHRHVFWTIHPHAVLVTPLDVLQRFLFLFFFLNSHTYTLRQSHHPVLSVFRTTTPIHYVSHTSGCPSSSSLLDNNIYTLRWIPLDVLQRYVIWIVTPICYVSHIIQFCLLSGQLYQ